MSTLRRLPSSAEQRRYLVLAAIDSLGTGMFIPVTVIFLVRVVHLSTIQIGVGLTGAGICSLLVTPMIGRFGDRFDARRLAIVGYAVCAIGFSLYPWIDSFATFVVLAVLIQVFERVELSARQLIALSIAAGEGRIRLLAYERTARNVGFGVGGLVASLALLSSSRAAFAAVLTANAASYAVGVVLLIRMPSAHAATRTDGEALRYFDVLRDRAYVLLAILTALLWLNDSVLRVGMPLWIIHRTTLPPSLNGVYFAVNTAVVVLLQIRISKTAVDGRGAARAYRLAAILLAACCGLFALTSALRPPGAVAVIMLAAVCALTVGEVLTSAAQWATSISFLREEARGRYLAVFSTFSSAQGALGPVLLTVAIRKGGDWGWLALGSLFVFAGATAARTTRRRAALSGGPPASVMDTADAA